MGGVGFSPPKLVDGGLCWFPDVGPRFDLGQIGGVYVVFVVAGLCCVPFSKWFLPPILAGFCNSSVDSSGRLVPLWVYFG